MKDDSDCQHGVLGIKALLISKREEILHIAASHGARNVRVFGSVARGEADEKSDIDLLVEFEPGRSLLDHARALAGSAGTPRVQGGRCERTRHQTAYPGTCPSGGRASVRDPEEQLRDILDAIARN